MPKLYYNTAIRGLHAYKLTPIGGERVSIREDIGKASNRLFIAFFSECNIKSMKYLTKQAFIHNQS